MKGTNEKSYHHEAFDIPEGYFDDLEDQVLKRWHATNRGVRIRKLFWFAPVAASVVAAMIAVIVMFSTDVSSWEERLNEEELAYYYLYTDGMQDVWYDLGDIDENELVDWLVSEQADIELLEKMY